MIRCVDKQAANTRRAAFLWSMTPARPEAPGGGRNDDEESVSYFGRQQRNSMHRTVRVNSGRPTCASRLERDRRPPVHGLQHREDQVVDSDVAVDSRGSPCCHTRFPSGAGTGVSASDSDRGRELLDESLSDPGLVGGYYIAEDRVVRTVCFGSSRAA
jgi:hypothetical protein